MHMQVFPVFPIQPRLTIDIQNKTKSVLIFLNLSIFCQPSWLHLAHNCDTRGEFGSQSDVQRNDYEIVPNREPHRNHAETTWMRALRFESESSRSEHMVRPKLVIAVISEARQTCCCVARRWRRRRQPVGMNRSPREHLIYSSWMLG